MKNLYDDLALFCGVINSGSFYKASRHLGLPHSTVSRRIALLEQSLGEQLIERTTRQMHVTEKGQNLFNRCEPLFQQLRVAISDSLDDEVELKGPMKITMPTRVGLDYMGEILIDFNRLHPKLELDIQLDNAMNDLVAENIDLAIRVGPLVDSTAIAVKLWDIPFVLLASRETVANYNIDVDNFELKHISFIPCAVATPLHRWKFDHEENGEMIISPNITLQTNDLSIAVEAAIKTNVLVYVPKIVLFGTGYADQLVALGGCGWKPDNRVLYAVYTASRKSSQKVKKVISYTKQAFFERFSGEDIY